MPTQPEHKIIGARFKEFRTSNNLTHAQIAEDTGQTVLTVSRIENGHRLPNIEMLIFMSRKYGMNIEQVLLGGGAEKSKKSKTADIETQARIALLEARVEKIDRIISRLTKKP